MALLTELINYFFESESYVKGLILTNFPATEHQTARSAAVLGASWVSLASIWPTPWGSLVAFGSAGLAGWSAMGGDRLTA